MFRGKKKELKNMIKKEQPLMQKEIQKSVVS